MSKRAVVSCVPPTNYIFSSLKASLIYRLYYRARARDEEKERREERESKEAQMRRVANLEALMEEYYKKGISFIFFN